MDGLTFTSEVIKSLASLAWPITAFALVYLFRGPLKRLLETLTQLEYKDFKAKFAERVMELQIEAEKLPPATLEVRSFEEIQATDSLTVDLSDKATTAAAREEFGDLYPAAAILQSWLLMEKRLREAAARSGVPNSDRSPTLKLAEELHQQGRVSQDVFDLFKKVRNLRNTLVHVRVDDLTPSEAVAFQAITSKLATAFTRIEAPPKTR